MKNILMDQNSKHLEEIIDACLNEIRTKRKSLEDCLLDYPDFSSELEPLLRLYLRLDGLPRIEATDSFKSSSPSRLINTINLHNSSDSTNQKLSVLDIFSIKFSKIFNQRNTAKSYGFRFASLIIVSVLLLIVLSSGLYSASAKSLPGEFLYPAKLFFESLEIRISQSDANNSEMHLTHASKRIEETIILLGDGNTEHLGSSMLDYSTDIVNAISILVESESLTDLDRTLLAVKILDDLRLNEDQIVYILSITPDEYKDSVENALSLIRFGHAIVSDGVNNINLGILIDDDAAYSAFSSTSDDSGIYWPTVLPTIDLTTLPSYIDPPEPYLRGTELPAPIGTAFPWWALDPARRPDGFDWPSTWPTPQYWPSDYPQITLIPLMSTDIIDLLPDLTPEPRDTRDRLPVQRTPRPSRP